LAAEYADDAEEGGEEEKREQRTHGGEREVERAGSLPRSGQRSRALKLEPRGPERPRPKMQKRQKVKKGA
jgi:hypothetical protein